MLRKGPGDAEGRTAAGGGTRREESRLRQFGTADRDQFSTVVERRVRIELVRGLGEAQGKFPRRNQWIEGGKFLRYALYRKRSRDGLLIAGGLEQHSKTLLREDRDAQHRDEDGRGQRLRQLHLETPPPEAAFPMREQEAGARGDRHQKGHQGSQKAPAEECAGVVGESRPPPGDHESLAAHRHIELDPPFVAFRGQGGGAAEPEVSSVKHGGGRIAAKQKVICDPRCPRQERNLRGAVGDPQRHACARREPAFGLEDRLDAGGRFAFGDRAPARGRGRGRRRIGTAGQSHSESGALTGRSPNFQCARNRQTGEPGREPQPVRAVRTKSSQRTGFGVERARRLLERMADGEAMSQGLDRRRVERVTQADVVLVRRHRRVEEDPREREEQEGHEERETGFVGEQRLPEMPQGKPSAAPERHCSPGEQGKSGEKERTAGQECHRNGYDRGGGHQHRNFRPEKALEEEQESGESEKQGSPAEDLRPAGVERPGRGQQRAA